MDLAAVMGLMIEQREQDMSGARFLHAVAANAALADRRVELRLGQAVHQGDELFVFFFPRIFERFEVIIKNLIKRTDPGLPILDAGRPQPVDRQKMIEGVVD